MTPSTTTPQPCVPAKVGAVWVGVPRQIWIRIDKVEGDHITLHHASGVPLTWSKEELQSWIQRNDALCIPAAPPSATPPADNEEILADHRALVRRLDVALNGEDGAAKQASLCDLVGQVEGEGWRLVRVDPVPSSITPPADRAGDVVALLLKARRIDNTGKHQGWIISAGAETNKIGLTTHVLPAALALPLPASEPAEVTEADVERALQTVGNFGLGGAESIASAMRAVLEQFVRDRAALTAAGRRDWV